MNFIYEPNQIIVKDEEDNVIVRATFPFIKDHVVNVNHTFVDPKLRGQGIASILMHEVVHYAKKMNYLVVATCPYAVVWFKKHKEYQDIIDDMTQSELAPECQI